jgi:L-arabinose isomerase
LLGSGICYSGGGGGARVGYLLPSQRGLAEEQGVRGVDHAQLGTHIEVLEMCDLQVEVDKVSDEEVRAKRTEVESFFEISGDSATDRSRYDDSPRARHGAIPARPQAPVTGRRSRPR